MAAISKMSLVELFHKLGVSNDGDFLREALKVLAQAVIELEASMKAGAERYERTEERITSRNGARPSYWKTRVGKIELQIPKLRKGSYYPSFLGKDQRRQTERRYWRSSRRHRPLEAAYPYLWLDATFVKVRANGRVRSGACRAGGRCKPRFIFGRPPCSPLRNNLIMRRKPPPSNLNLYAHVKP